ncbi:hypothetical protein [Clostridium sp. Cult2]|uniref:hypothetical protein n=1 Tax=Clostridium sp. Cult2 TaxID=2079003 RepID=UPI001F28C484|nr:hypothetical protein [Clostridium sp. Cult2]MCF6466334.1 hypothetical protein [Clostridium sp. Cult2]
MPSEIKTPNIGLNQWQGNEYPKRQDFVDDNLKIDTEIGNLKNIAHGAVTDITDLKAIDTTNMPDNITIIVKTLGFYRFDSASVLTPDDKAVVQPTVGVGRWINDLAVHQAETTQQAHLAKNIGVEDVDNNFVATDVEGALDELFQSGLDGKNLLETSIKSKGGTVSKAGEVATFNELDTGIKSIETDKTGDATAVANDIRVGKTAYARGVKLLGDMPDNGDQSETLTITGSKKPTINIPAGYTTGGAITAQLSSTLASLILEGNIIGGVTGTLVRGKKWASGSSTVSSDKRSFVSSTGGITIYEYVAISDLSFAPTIIICTTIDNNKITFYMMDGFLEYNATIVKAIQVIAIDTKLVYNLVSENTSYPIYDSGVFYIPFSKYGNIDPMDVIWTAYE